MDWNVPISLPPQKVCRWHYAKDDEECLWTLDPLEPGVCATRDVIDRWLFSTRSPHFRLTNNARLGQINPFSIRLNVHEQTMRSYVFYMILRDLFTPQTYLIPSYVDASLAREISKIIFDELPILILLRS